MRGHLNLVKKNIPILLNIAYLIFLYCNGNFFMLANKYVPYINLLFSLFVIYKVRNIKASKVVPMLVAILYIVFASMINGSSFGAATAFLAVFTYVLYFENIWINATFMKILLLMGFCMIMWYVPQANTIYNNFIAGKEIYSPNSISMVLVVIFVWYSTYFHMKKDKFNIWIILLYIFMMVMVFMMKTRSALIILLLYGILLWIVPRKMYNSRKIVTYVALIIIFFGCIFPVIYVSMSSNSQIADFIYNMTGKYLFTGRDLIWKRFFIAIEENKMGFLWGLGSKAEYSIGQGLSLHNSYLNIILNYGIGGIVILQYFICLKIRDLYENNSNGLTFAQVSLLSGYFCLLVESCAEVTLLTSYMVLFTNMLFGLCLNRYFCKNIVT